MQKEKLRQENYWKDLFSSERNKNPVLNALKDNALFSDFSHTELRYLENIVHIRKFEAGEYVFQQNEIGIGMYIIAKGRIEIRVTPPEKGSTSEEVVITTLEKGSFFGEQALIESESKRTATALVTEPTMLIAFLKPDLMDIIHRKPSLGVKITIQLARVLGKRLKRTTDRLSEFASKSAIEVSGV